MKQLAFVAFAFAATLAAAGTAHAAVGIGLFVGEPVGLDLKLDTGYRSALDIVLGWTTFRDARDHYAHFTYLATPFVGEGDTIRVPLRIGVGVAFYDDGDFNSGLNVAVRAPIELALRFRSTPIELYGELALAITFIDANNNNDTFDVQGGVGIRAFF